MTTTYAQDKELHEAISDQLGDMSWLFDLIRDIADPEDIFSKEVLVQWARDNGFIEAGDNL